MDDDTTVSFRPPVRAEGHGPGTASGEVTSPWPDQGSAPAKRVRTGETDFGNTLWGFCAGTILAALLILLLVTNLKVERVDTYDRAILPLPFGNELNLELGTFDGQLLWRDSGGSAREIIAW